MADKSISELVAATSVGSSDLFVLEQANTAKKLTGQILENWLVSFADGHGGIQSIAKTGSTGTNPVVDTYTITLSDTTTYDITVTNGVKGDTGAQTYVWIKWAAQQPTANNQMSNNPDKWIGIYTGTASTAPSNYTSYQWYEYKGEKGDTGDSITRITKTSGSGDPGTTDVYTMYAGDPGVSIGTFTVYNGLNGTGTVNSVNDVLPDANGNVELTIPTDYVESVNNVPPDANGNVTLDIPYASQIDLVSGERDLNNYTIAGMYYFSTGVTLSNAPSGSTDGWLTVLVSSTGAVKQIWHRQGSNPTTFKDFYMRLCGTDSVWGSWVPIMTGWIQVWENGSPNSQMASGSISVNLNGYSHLAVLYRAYPTSDNENSYMMALGKVGNKLGLQITSYFNHCGERILSTGSDSISVNNCCYNAKTDTTYNNYAVPISIWGIRI